MTERKTTPFWVVIGTIGGVRLFLQLFFSIFGTYFSSKFVTATLANELYVKLRNQQRKSTKIEGEYEGGNQETNKKYHNQQDEI